MKIVFFLLVWFTILNATGLESISFDARDGLQITACKFNDQQVVLPQKFSLFSVEIDDSLFFSGGFPTRFGDSIQCQTAKLSLVVRTDPEFEPGYRLRVRFTNTSDTTVKIANVVPLGQGSDRAYMTGYGDFSPGNYLTRTVLFTPDLAPVGVIVPDNAWEAGFCDIPIAPDASLVALARRTAWNQVDRRRWWTTLQPGGNVEYTFYLDVHPGRDWRTGLRMMFHERWLYDLPEFDRSLYDRDDLKWIRDQYFMIIQMAWDKDYYDRGQSKYSWYEFIKKYDRLWGHLDVYVLWPTWPRLGLDQRNQWDLYGDLPGGLPELRRQVDFAHKNGTHYFISYNPWDTDTRNEDHLAGMEQLLRQTNADGVVLDTRGESGKELQETADRVKKGIVMYSEGMAVPKHMPGIVTGRVHDAIYLPPPINLIKYIFPENQIFRVMQLTEGHLHREANICLFNGYALELNVMRAGRPDWMETEFRYIGRVLKTLRDNSAVFSLPEYQPLIPVAADSIWVNRWEHPAKTLYTIYSLIPEGFDGPLIEVSPDTTHHFVSLWQHKELDTVKVAGKIMIPARTHAFDRAWLRTRQESQVDCIARFKKLISVQVTLDSLTFNATQGNRLVLWAGNPTYETVSKEFTQLHQTVSLRQFFGNYEGKFVVQLFEDRELIDETTFEVPLATPRATTRIKRTSVTKKTFAEMTLIPGGTYSYQVAKTDEPNLMMVYPDFQTPHQIEMKPFLIDTWPVTNQQFQEFMKSTKYHPKDTVNFLAHWRNGKPPQASLNHPVVNVSLEDARAYAKWAGKRLPSDIEWQYAAQGTDSRQYPWGNEMDSTRCNYKSGATTPVNAFPTGASPFGVMDLVGNVWQLVDDVYDNGTYSFAVMRGGSFYFPDASIWYVTGGPWRVDQQKLLLLVSPGFDRSATVGFRCAKDVN